MHFLLLLQAGHFVPALTRSRGRHGSRRTERWTQNSLRRPHGMMIEKNSDAVRVEKVHPHADHAPDGAPGTRTTGGRDATPSVLTRYLNEINATKAAFTLTSPPPATIIGKYGFGLRCVCCPALKKPRLGGLQYEAEIAAVRVRMRWGTHNTFFVGRRQCNTSSDGTSRCVWGAEMICAVQCSPEQIVRKARAVRTSCRET